MSGKLPHYIGRWEKEKVSERGNKMYNKNNCAHCNFHIDTNHKEKTVYCSVHREWRDQYNACEYWTEPARMTENDKIELAKQIREEIMEEERARKVQERHEEQKELNKELQNKQLKQQNKLSWRQIKWNVISGIIGVILGFLLGRFV